jgi:hypothetical protein
MDFLVVFNLLDVCIRNLSDNTLIYYFQNQCNLQFGESNTLNHIINLKCLTLVTLCSVTTTITTTTATAITTKTLVTTTTTATATITCGQTDVETARNCKFLYANATNENYF